MTPPPPGSYGVPGKLTPYGGDGIWYAASLVIKTIRTGKLEAIVGGIKKKFGTKSKIVIEKNHMNGIEQSGEFVITPSSIIPDEPKAIKTYKDENKDTWGDLELLEEEGD